MKKQTPETINILALDPGLTTGYAYFYESKLESVGSIKFNGSYLDYKLQLDRLLTPRPVDIIIFEELLAFGARMNGERFKFEAIIELVAEESSKEKATMHPGTVKKLITGKGNCKKADLRKVLKDRIEIPGKSNVHVVDAVCTAIGWLIQNTEYVL